MGAGLPMAFFLLKLMGDVDSSLEGLKYVSMNSLFDTSAIIDGGNVAVPFAVLAVIGIALYLFGMRVFKEKDLPL